MTRIKADQLARDAWSGDSPPLSTPSAANEKRLHEVSWWESHPKVEAFGDRHRAAIRLYLRIAEASKMRLSDNEFPAKFILGGRDVRSPDKGVIKTCLSALPPLIVPRNEGSHLIWCLTSEGILKLNELR